MIKNLFVAFFALVLILCLALPAFAADPVPVESIVLDAGTEMVPAGKTLNVKVNIEPKNATAKKQDWTSSDETVATVQNGKVKGIAPGTATITAKAMDNSGVTASLEIRVVQPVKKITIDAGKTLNLPVGYTQMITLNIQPDDATVKDVTWTSSNEKVATVDNNGLVTAVAKGKGKITAEAADGSKVKAVVNVVVDEYDLMFFDDSPQQAEYYFGSGRIKVTGKSKNGCVSVPKNIAEMLTMIVGGLASETVTITPVKPGADVVTIKAGKTKTVIKVYVSPDAFKKDDAKGNTDRANEGPASVDSGKFKKEWKDYTVSIRDIQIEGKTMTVSYTFENRSGITTGVLDIFEDSLTQDKQKCIRDSKSLKKLKEQQVKSRQTRDYQMVYNLLSEDVVAELAIGVKGTGDKPLVISIDPKTGKWGKK